MPSLNPVLRLLAGRLAAHAVPLGPTVALARRSPLNKLAPLAILAFAALIYWCGALETIDQNAMDWRFRLLQRPPSDSLVIVEIDHRSITELPAWPWPRAYHAEVLDNLFAAGAHSVGVDIDFSSTSTPAADAALAAAFERHAGHVVLPAFLQVEGSAGGRPAIVETLPNPLFRDHVQLGAVNVRPAADSLVRQFPAGEMFGETAIPSLASRLAGDSRAAAGDFYLDFGIRIRDATRISYADVLNGRFDPRAVRGKNVLIGATAVELGDQFAVPIHRALPGPILQALGYESLVQHRALQRSGPTAGFALAVLVLLVLVPLSARWDWRRHLLALAAVWATLFGASVAVAAVAPISLDLALPAAAALLFCLVGCLRRFEQQARLLLQQRLADTRRRALMQSVLEDSFDGILVTDAGGVIEMANRAAGRLLGCAPETMAGMPVGKLLPVTPPPPEQLAGARLSAEEFVVAPLAPSEIELPQPDGAPLTLELAVSGSRVPFGGKRRNDERIFLTYTFRDISERRRAEEALRAAMQEAQAANRAKTEFLANMSHELRTPLNAIIGFSDLIKGEAFGALPSPRYGEYAGDINNSGRHLLEVINDILDMAKFEAGELRLDEDLIDLGEMVDRCVHLARGVPGADALHFATEIEAASPQLRGDPRIVRQMIGNVLANAVKFTPAGGAVTVIVESVASGLAIRIRDTGIGIPSDAIPHIVRPFYQVDSELARKYEGTGLGLALVNAYIRLHGGELVIDSQLDKGTTMSLLLPAERLVGHGAAAFADLVPAGAPAGVPAREPTAARA